MTARTEVEAPLERRLRKHDFLQGTPIRLQDGEVWIFPACPLEGPVSDRICGLIATFDDLADEEDPDALAGRIDMMRRQHKVVMDLALAALQINYPDLAREQLAERLTKAHMLPIVRAINGLTDLEALLQPPHPRDASGHGEGAPA